MSEETTLPQASKGASGPAFVAIARAAAQLKKVASTDLPPEEAGWADEEEDWKWELASRRLHSASSVSDAEVVPTRWQRFCATVNRVAPNVFDPAGTFGRRWDVIIFFALLYTVVITPFEIAFLTARACRSAPLRLQPARSLTRGAPLSPRSVADTAGRDALHRRAHGPHGGRLAAAASLCGHDILFKPGHGRGVHGRHPAAVQHGGV